MENVLKEEGFFENESDEDLLFSYLPKNPEQLEHRLKFWRSVLERYMEAFGAVSVTKEVLYKDFTFSSRKAPLDLERLIYELEDRKYFVHYADYVAENGIDAIPNFEVLQAKLNLPAGAKERIGLADYVSDAFRWTFSSIVELIGFPAEEYKDKRLARVENSVYVVPSQIEAVANVLYSEISPKLKIEILPVITSIEALKLFRRAVKKRFPLARTREIREGFVFSLMHLAATGRVVILDKARGIVLKGEKDKQDESLLKIYNGIINLMETKRKVEEKIDLMNTKIEETRKRARSYYTYKQKGMAQMELRKTVLLNKHLQSLLGILEKLSGILLTIESAKINKDVVASFYGARDTLKEIVKETDVDDVEDLISELAELQELNEEVSQVVSLDSTEPVDEEELEKEMELLLEDEVAEEVSQVKVSSDRPQERDSSFVDVSDVSVEEPEKRKKEAMLL